MRNPLLLVLFATVFLFHPSSQARAQWDQESCLVHSDTAAVTSPTNARCVACGSGGWVHAVWWDTRNGFGEIYSKHSTDGGTSWSEDTRLTYDPARSLYPAVAVSGTKVHVAWSEDRDGNYEIYYKRSTDNGATWSPDIRLTNAVNNSWFPSISAVGDDVHVAWWDYRDWNHEIYYKRSTDGGTTWSSDTRLTNALGDSWYPSIAASGPNVHVAWWDNRDGNYEIYYKKSIDNGLSWGQDIRLTNDSSWSCSPCITCFGERVYVTWEDDRNGAGEIYYKWSSDGGNSWTQDTRLTVDPAWSVMPSIWASGPKIHLVWDDERDGNEEIYFKGSSDSGLTWSPDLRLSHGLYNSTYPSIAAFDSMVHVVWTDSRSGNPEIYYDCNPTGNSGTAEGTGIRDKGKGIRITARPNPFASFATVPGHEGERFKLYDIMGRMVGTYEGAQIGEGLATGGYFIRTADGTSKPVRIVKIR